jgi:hypothetical protein
MYIEVEKARHGVLSFSVLMKDLWGECCNTHKTEEECVCHGWQMPGPRCISCPVCGRKQVPTKFFLQLSREFHELCGISGAPPKDLTAVGRGCFQESLREQQTSELWACVVPICAQSAWAVPLQIPPGMEAEFLASRRPWTWAARPAWETPSSHQDWSKCPGWERKGKGLHQLIYDWEHPDVTVYAKGEECARMWDCAILATREAEIRMIVVWGQPRQKVLETPSQLMKPWCGGTGMSSSYVGGINRRTMVQANLDVKWDPTSK